MGREIRSVTPDWEHPKDDRGKYIPMFNQDYKSAADGWIDSFKDWLEGKYPDQVSGLAKDGDYFWDWAGNPPDRESYRERSWTEKEATHFQMYETVSEGTPVSPVFATLQELAEYLIANGDFWDQKRGNGGWSREAAEAFVKQGFAMSMMFTPQTGVVEPRDAAMYAENRESES